MKTLKAPRKSLGRRAASIPALLVLGTLGGTALAATDIAPPCPEATRSSDALNEFVERSAATTIARTIDASETISSRPLADAVSEKSASDTEELSSAEKPESNDSAIPEYTSRLPGVSVNDLPGFRRHMYRTDI